MAIIDWLVDTMARTETLDLYFALSDLKDIPLSEGERLALDEGDSAAAKDTRTWRKEKKPLGLQVW
jgi:hypothetical protein